MSKRLITSNTIKDIWLKERVILAVLNKKFPNKWFIKTKPYNRMNGMKFGSRDVVASIMLVAFMAILIAQKIIM